MARPDRRAVAAYPEGNQLLSRLIPDQIGSLDLRPACEAHDERYATLGFPKDEADELLRQELLNLCPAYVAIAEGPWEKALRKTWCEWVAETYFDALQEHGDEAYKNAQEQALTERNKSE